MRRARAPAGTSRRPPLIRVARVAAAVVAAWLVVTIGVRVAYAGRILPGTTMAGLGLGGLSAGAAERVLSTALASRTASVTVTAAGRRFVVDPAVVGYRIDIAASVASARDAGRGGPGLGIASTIPALIAPRSREPVTPIDDGLLDAQIASIAAAIDRPARAGDVRVDADAPGAIRVIAPQAQRRLARDAARQALLRALRDRPRRPADLPVRRRGGASSGAVRGVARQAREYVRTPLQLVAGRRTLTLTTAQTAAILALEHERGADPGALALGVDAPAVARLVDALAADLDRAPVSARVDAPGRPRAGLDGQGDVSWRPRAAQVAVTPAAAGRELRRAGAAAALTTAVRRRSHRVVLTFKRLPARLTTGGARAIDALLGTFTTRYPCCQPRVTNIRLIAEAIDGTVVLPGEPFSLNGTSGERTRAGGYVKAPFIADGELAESIGGGVSQVATTLYNAAFFAGLRIDAHRPHSFYIDRYPPGREATLNYPDIDVRWTNDTPAPVLVRAVTDATSVVVSLYGGDSGRRVRAQTGERMPLADGDFAITVTRVLRFRDGTVVRQPFTTRYDRPPAPG